MSSERSSDSGTMASGGEVELAAASPTAAVRAPAAATDQTLHESLRTPEGGTPPAHALLGNLDTKGLQREEWRLAQEVRTLAERGVTGKDLTGVLVSCGLKDSEAQKVLSFAKLAQKAYPSRTVNAELLAELRLVYFFSQHYDLDSESYDVEERRPTNRNLLWRVRRLVEECEALQDVRPEELRAAGFGVQDLFHRDARTIDGVSVYTRLDIARWLNGPYANVRKPEEVKKLLPKLDLDLTMDIDADESPSSQLNLAAWSVLKADRLFCVMEEHEHESLDPHARLTFLPADGSAPVTLDFSFHQLFPKEDLKSPFVGTHADLQALAKSHKAQTRVMPLFEGSARTAACQNVTLEVIQAIRTALTQREPEAVYN